MRSLFLLLAFLSISDACHAEELNREQRLVIACYHVDIDGVIKSLREGADVNGRFGKADPQLLKDPWMLGWPVTAGNWTPLIALANASIYTNPPRKIENTEADILWAANQLNHFPKQELEKRQRSVMTIARILLSHSPEIDAHDGVGATALYFAISERKLELARLLLKFDPDVNTTTGEYFGYGGTYNTTPLHVAFWSGELTKLLLNKGAAKTAKDSRGKTPADWSRLSKDPAVARLYQLPKH
jgi:hypothetical protein